MNDPRWSLTSLFAGVAAMNGGMIGASTVSTLVADHQIGAASSGLPNAVAVLGTAGGAIALARMMRERGRRAGLTTGYLSAAAGAVLAATLGVNGHIWALLPAMALLGIGNAAAQQARYAAAELVPATRRGAALGVVVWAGTIGAAVGPRFLEPSTRQAAVWGLDPYAGPFVIALVAALAAAAVSAGVHRKPAPWVRRPTATITATPTATITATPTATVAAPHAQRTAALRVTGRGAWRLVGTDPAVRVALAAMLSAQAAMVAVMTMAPVHIDHAGHTIGAIALPLTLHAVGMFGLAPLWGRAADRAGPRAVIVAGIVLTAGAALAAPLVPADGVGLALALLVLGLGWSACYVAGSTVITREVPARQRAVAEGAVDAVTWGSSAVTSLGAGWVLGMAGFATVAALGAAVMVLPVWVLVAEQRLR